MKSGWCLLSGLLIGCAAATPGAQAPVAAEPAHAAPGEHTGERTDVPLAAPARWKSRPADVACRANLTALSVSALADFRGLSGCGRVDAEATFGSSGDQPGQFEQFGEYRVYPNAGSSVLVWFLSDEIRVLQILYPKLKQPLRSMLGDPEAKVKSQLSPDWEQWVYATRGLTAHVRRASGEVITLFAYAPTTVEGFLKTDIAHVAKSEAPLEELK